MLQRIGISMEDELLEQFDVLIDERGYTNRSEAVRDLIREQLVQKEWAEKNKNSMGVAMLVYDHHTPDLNHHLAHVQHDHFAQVVSTLHVHIDHHNCLELLILKGKTGEIQKLGDALTSTRGVKYGRFVPATTGENLK